MLSPGDVVAGRYELTAHLGTGGMGTVFLARDKSLDIDIALKVIRSDFAASERHRARIKNEVKLARAIAHPNVCRIHDLIESDGMLLLSMEYMEGEALDERIDRGEANVADAVQILKEIAIALRELHNRGILHRDIKPSNVFLSKDGRTVLLDFGIAHAEETPASERLTREGALVGTPQYMAPEQLETGQADKKGDVYALGLIGYELLTQTRPLLGPTVHATLANRMRDPVPPVRSIRPDVSESLDAFISRCLERNPDDRLADGGAAYDALLSVEAAVESERPLPEALLAKNQLATKDMGPAAGPSPTMTAEERPIRTAEASVSTPSPPRRAQWPKAVLVLLPLVAALVFFSTRAPSGRAKIRMASVDRASLDGSKSFAAPALERFLVSELEEGWGLTVEREAGQTPSKISEEEGVFSAEIHLEAAGASESHSASNASVAALAQSLAERIGGELEASAAGVHPDQLDRVGTSSPVAYRAWRRARRAFALESVARVRAHATTATLADPRFPLPYLEVAATYEPTNPRGRDAIRRAAELKSSASARWQAEIEAYEAYYAGDDAGLEKAADRLIELAKDDPLVQARFAEHLLWEGHTEDALALLERSLQRWPDDALAPRILAEHYIGSFEVFDILPRSASMGLTYAARATVIAPANTRARALLSVAALFLGQDARALEEAQIGVAIDPSAIEPAVALFSYYTKHDDRHRSRQAARRLLGGPAASDSAGRYLLGSSDLSYGRFDRGFEQLAESCRGLTSVSPGRAARCFADRGWFALQLDEIEIAAESFAAAQQNGGASLYGAVDDAELLLAAVNKRRGRADVPDLMAIAKKLGEKGSVGSGPALHFELFAAWESGSSEEVQRIYRKLGDDDGLELWALYAVAKSLENDPDPERALKLLNRLSRNPFAWSEPIFSVKARLLAGNILEGAGRVQEAADAYEDAVAKWGEASKRVPEVEEARARLAELRRP